MKSSETGPGPASSVHVQVWVFTLVVAAFTTIYITQPVLPILQVEFGLNETWASLSISAVILGITLSNLPLGRAADRFRIKPLIITGGLVVSACGMVCALTSDFHILAATRFVQGLFLPCLTTCVATYLAKTVPIERLNVAMGSYVSATVAGGLGGRLLGGFIHPPLHWRYAFVSASLFLLIATVAAAWFLPAEKEVPSDLDDTEGFIRLLKRPDLLRIFFVAFSAVFVFSSIFNYLPFYLSSPPFNVSTQLITLTYTTYLVGIVIGPLGGKMSNRVGNGATMALGAVIFAGALGMSLIQTLSAVAASLALMCAGFFSVHAAAAGSLNTRLTAGRGRANSLYVLFYYIGAFTGISASGYMYVSFGWPGIVAMGAAMLAVPFTSGVWEFIKEREYPFRP